MAAFLAKIQAKKSPVAKRGEGKPGSQGLSGVESHGTMLTVSLNDYDAHITVTINRRPGFEKVPALSCKEEKT